MNALQDLGVKWQEVWKSQNSTGLIPFSSSKSWDLSKILLTCIKISTVNSWLWELTLSILASNETQAWAPRFPLPFPCFCPALLFSTEGEENDCNLKDSGSCRSFPENCFIHSIKFKSAMDSNFNVSYLLTLNAIFFAVSRLPAITNCSVPIYSINLLFTFSFPSIPGAHWAIAVVLTH